MPVYDFKCPKCEETRTQTLSIHENDFKAVCKCGEQMRKVFTPPPIMFRGNGFYKTDK
jgi:putative FmdB family regulatory protein